jgi:catechol 2,3-dioxygenase-like lactoylglutathione lyase family enzyme
MAEAITGIDHVMVGVADLDDAAARYRRLGFALTPRGRHPRTGTANHCAMFGARNYLELMTVVEPGAADDMFGSAIAAHAGIAALAFQTGDARAVGRRWAASGLSPRAPIELRRPVETARGREEARFCLVSLAADRLPGMMGFACQHDTPHLVWRPGSTEHPNGARGIAAVTGVAEAPDALAEVFGRVVGSDRVERRDGALVVATGGPPIRFVAPARFRAQFGFDAPARLPALAALTITVRSLDDVKRLLDGGSLGDIVLTSDRATVGAAHAAGAVIDFVEG